MSVDRAFYWRVELTASVIPVVYTYLLDAASRRYREADVFTGLPIPRDGFELYSPA